MKQKRNLKTKISQLEKELSELRKLEQVKEITRTETAKMEKSEQKVNSMPHLICILDEEATVVDVLESENLTINLSSDNMSGLSMNELLPELPDIVNSKPIREAIKERRIIDKKYKIDKDNKTHHYQNRIVPLPGNKLLYELTELPGKYNAEEMAVKKADFLYRVMSESPVPIVKINRRGKVLFRSESAVQLFDIIDPKRNPEYCEMCQQILKNEFKTIEAVYDALAASEDEFLSFMVKAKDPQGKIFSLKFSILTVDDPLEEDKQLFVYIQDVTDYLEQNRLLRENQLRLHEVQRLSKIAYWEYHPEEETFRGFGQMLDFLNIKRNFDDISKEAFFDFVYPDDRERVKHWFRIKAGRQQNFVEKFRILADDRLFWLEVRSRVKNVQEQETPLIVGSVQDITDRKTQEDLLKRSRHLRDTLLEKIPVAVYVKDAETFRYNVWNHAAEKLFGISKHKVLGKTDEDIFPESVATVFRHRGRTTIESKMTVEFQEEEFEFPRNSKKLINFVQVPVIMKKEVHALLGIAMDITGKKLVENQLIHARDQAEKSDKLKSTYLANMSHEIRNPMNAIVGFSRILVEDENLDPADKEEFIALINENAQHLLSLISDIIDIAKIENNRLKIFKTTFNLNEKLKKLAAKFRQQMKNVGKNDIMLKLETERKDNGFSIHTDENRFVQILNNLVTNAIKFTREGEICIGYELVSGQAIRFFVRDTGIGIEENQQHKVFDEFYQADRADAPAGKGLGLSISKQLVTYLGGEIWLESSRGKGTTFYFTLPYNNQTGRNPTSEANDNPGQQIAKAQKKAKSIDWSGNKILIVDDAKDILTFVSILLKKTNIEIHTAESGTEAIKKVKQNDGDYDVILMDIQMPDISGIIAMKEIRKLYSGIKIFAQTAFALEGDEQKFLKQGFDAYIAKPVNKNDLFAKIARVIEAK